ncbi:MAG: amidohydrolase [Hyphomonadaceae bacterium]|nr:amidohydrolase [Hyphomonadaceae bacterium]
MIHDRHGCACCHANLGALFGYAPEQANEITVLPIGRMTQAQSGVVTKTACGTKYYCELTEPSGQDQIVRIYSGGTIMTVDASFSKAEAIAIQGAHILAVGRLDEVKQAAGDQVELIDLNGRTLMPGLIDPHTHILIGSLMDQAMDYVGTGRFSTTGEVLDFIARLDAERPPEDWIVCRNYYPMLQPFEVPLGFETLNAISSERPIFVLNASGHIAYANRAAFAAAGIPEDVNNPQGGEFVRDDQGALTGEMRNQMAFSQVLGARPSGAGSAPTEAVLKTCARFAELGLTTVTELGLGGLLRGAGDWDILRQAGATGRLSQRVRAYPLYAFDAAWDEAAVAPGDGDALVRMSGYKLIADGSNQGFTGLQREPYHSVESTGIAYMTLEEMTDLIRKRIAQGWQIAIHGNGDKAIDNILDAVEQVASEGVDVEAHRIRIEHCSILHDDQIERMKRFGITASFLIGHVHYWGVAMRDQIFGPEKAKLLDRCASLERAGVAYTIHSDFFVTDPNPMHMIEMAVTRQSWREPDFALAPDECATREGAIRAMTSTAAWQIGSEHEIGSLEPGKFADFVILDRDPYSVPANEIKDIKVLETWMGGEPTYLAGGPSRAA